MDLLCAPSRTTPRWREQFGRMLIEAMACGVPVIASPSGEIPYVVGDAGVLVPEGDPDGLAPGDRASARGSRDAALTCRRGPRTGAGAVRAGRSSRGRTWISSRSCAPDEPPARCAARGFPRGRVAEHGSGGRHAAGSAAARARRDDRRDAGRPPIEAAAVACVAGIAGRRVSIASPAACGTIRALPGRSRSLRPLPRRRSQLRAAGARAARASRTIVTCHDSTRSEACIEPERERRTRAVPGDDAADPRRAAQGGPRRLRHRSDAGAARSRRRASPSERTSVVHNGPHPSCSPHPEASADREAARLLGPPRSSVDLLHVGSAIPRKRIDLLIRIMAALGPRVAARARRRGRSPRSRRRSRAISASATSSCCRSSIVRRWRRFTAAARCW